MTVQKEDIQRIFNYYAEKSTDRGDKIAKFIGKWSKYITTKAIIFFGVLSILVVFTIIGMINRKQNHDEQI
jgi:hypothetical protein